MRAEPTTSDIPDHWVRRLVAVTVVAAALYAAFAAFGDYRALRETLSGFQAWTLPVAVGLVLAGYGLRALRWRLYLRRLGVDSPMGESALVFLSGFAMGVTPGKMGEVVKAYYLRERRGTPYAASIPAVIAERANDLLSVAALLGVGLLFVPSPAGLLLGSLGIAGVLLGLVVLRSARIVGMLLDLLARVRRLARPAQTLRGMHANLRPLLGGGLLLQTTLLGFAGWALEALAMWVLAIGFGIPLSWGACAFVFSAGSIAGVLSLLPGGLGVTEGGMVALLALLGVALSPATALTLAIRLCTLWLGVLVGLVAIAMLRTGRPASA
jgi:uncharacterized protein (TIRG00374 family)